MATVTEQRTTLRVICAWYGRVLGTKDGKGISGDSHTCCHECLTKMLAGVCEVPDTDDDAEVASC
jgi:hypothetical protein